MTPHITRGTCQPQKRGRGSFNFNYSSHALSVSNNGWTFDCGATDKMSYDPNDFLTYDRPEKAIIKTTNGEGMKIEGAGTISFSGDLTSKNWLFVPALSHKLLSVSQLTNDLNCTILM